ncbi:hypothetical protein C1701_05085 [Actinoalloteichus sp. AHMU CJ021]|uniref:Uncharacterized protein n=1 Tax=Actinoalloteichus caeruleus DSM 43889 TaxID=1120930 RepID=A0ABT1JH44_ACTCY|nr:hypothetical protein [Actinoalloteichus caeruleus]AUS77841.1 hypothetical protein C1701_05085 [Actinoalloteichus sp. AHMU CJ021]MCP2331797.1 hypothetical protein [Actinoalloteichus caeruleus DSM 43889]
MSESSPTDQESPEVAALRTEIDEAGHRARRSFEPGHRAAVIGAGMLLLVLGVVLPWAGDSNGIDVLLSRVPPELGVGILPQVFAVTVLLFGLVVSGVALAVRRWGLAWLSLIGCGHSIFEGMLAIWTRQTAPGAPGPGIGLLITVLAIFVITLQWVKIAWSRD